MIALIMIILLLAILFAWKGYHRLSIYFYAVSFVLATFWFFHHMTDTIGLML